MEGGEVIITVSERVNEYLVLVETRAVQTGNITEEVDHLENGIMEWSHGMELWNGIS